MAANRKAYLPKYGRFMGDGRAKVEPLLRHVEPGTRPVSIKKGTARALCDMLDDVGCSRHSSSGSTLWVLLEYCRANNIGFTLERHVTDGTTIAAGFTIRRRANTGGENNVA